jgi:hypothetical protein
VATLIIPKKIILKKCYFEYLNNSFKKKIHKFRRFFLIAVADTADNSDN